MNMQYTKGNILSHYVAYKDVAKYLMVVLDQARDTYEIKRYLNLSTMNDNIKEYRKNEYHGRYIIKDIIRLDLPFEDQINKLPCMNY